VVDNTAEDAMLKLIEYKRQEMLDIAEKHGRTNDLTIRSSEELDKLILEYQRLFVN
jgi:hypothetical protein